MDSMFQGCSSLDNLDISNFYYGNLNSINNAFEGADKIRYISIGNDHNSYLKNAIEYLNYKEHLIVCQKENIIENPNAINACCD